MNTPELTPWFPADVTPKRRGVYEVSQDTVTRWYAYFDGSGFGWHDLNPVDAFKNRDRNTRCDHRQAWRGLAQNPKATQ